MRVRNIFRQKGFFMLLMTGFAALLFGTAAAGRVYAGGDGESVRIRYVIAGAPFSVYRVGTLSGGNVIPADGFESYPVHLGDFSTMSLTAAAETYAAYAVRDHITPRVEGTTGEAGTLRIDGLPDGLYLIDGAAMEKDGNIYTPEPVLVPLSGAAQPGGGIPETVIKYSVKNVPKNPHGSGSPGGGGTPETVSPHYSGTIDLSLTVRKIWEDDGDTAKRPAKIRADLLKDGEKIAEAILSAENGWTYTFRHMDPAADYRIAEEVPDGYTVSAVRDGTTFFITNYSGTYPNGRASLRFLSGNLKQPKTSGRLPQTGQPWRRIGILAVIGAAFFALAGVGTLGNIRESRICGIAAGKEAEKAEKAIRSRREEIRAGEQDGRLPDYQVNPRIEMPVFSVDGDPCVGVLDIPSEGIYLPVGAETEEDVLKMHPCRYAGTAYLENLVICGHNYRSQFGAVKRLPEGTLVRFTDGDGNVFHYEIAAAEILRPEETEKAEHSGYPLSLITCTAGGDRRYVIRCRKKNEEP